MTTTCESFVDFCDRMVLTPANERFIKKRPDTLKTIEIIKKLGNDAVEYLDEKGITSNSEWIENWQMAKIRSKRPVDGKIWSETKKYITNKYHKYKSSSDIDDLLISTDQDDDGIPNGITIEIDLSVNKK